MVLHAESFGTLSASLRFLKKLYIKDKERFSFAPFLREYMASM